MPLGVISREWVSPRRVNRPDSDHVEGREFANAAPARLAYPGPRDLDLWVRETSGSGRVPGWLIQAASARCG